VPKDAKAKGFAINKTTETAILLHYGVKDAKDAKANESMCESNSETMIMREMLQKELDFCKKQLQAKDEQIERLQKLLDQEQQLRMVSEQKILLLEEKQEEPEPTKKRWQFWK
jgi:5-bromo-4-chloroindolyl phosphate hydrolysis protein